MDKKVIKKIMNKEKFLVIVHLILFIVTSLSLILVALIGLGFN